MKSAMLKRHGTADSAPSVVDPMFTSPGDLVADDEWLEHVDDGSELLALIFEEWSNDTIAPQQQQQQQQQQPKKWADQTSGVHCSEHTEGSSGGDATAERSSGDAAAEHSSVLFRDEERDQPGGSHVCEEEAKSASKRKVSISSKRERRPKKEAGSGGDATTTSRWRQSQCRMGSLEAEAHRKQELAEKAESLNTELKFRALALEHTLAARDVQVEILKQHRAAAARESTTSSQSSRSCATSLSTAEQPSWSDTSAEANSALTAFHPATATISSLAAQLRQFVSQASILLLQISGVEASGADTDPKVEKLSEMVHTFCGHMGAVFVLNTHTQYEILSRRLDTSGAEEPSTAPPGHWDQVVREMQATANQLKEVAACWEFNGAAVMKLHSDIEAVRGRLDKAVQLGMSGTPACAELQAQLSTALLNQALTCRAMGYILFIRILTPLQTARAIVHSFPYFPNGRELLMRLVQQQQGGSKV